MTLPQLDELNLLHSQICRALGDPRRIQILYALHEEARHVTALAEDLGMPQSTVSRHLSVLRQCALVTTERNGPAIIYTLVDDRLIRVLDEMRSILRDLLVRKAEIVM